MEELGEEWVGAYFLDNLMLVLMESFSGLSNAVQIVDLFLVYDGLCVVFFGTILTLFVGVALLKLADF